MTIYEINAAMEALVNKVDPETGEILFDPQELEDLQMAREEKIENAACMVKNLKAEAAAIGDEVKNLNARKKTLDAKVERLHAYLMMALDGEKFSSPKVAVSFRESKSVEVDDGFVDWAMINAPELLRYKEPEADKTAIKDAIKAGAELEMAREVTSRSVVIK